MSLEYMIEVASCLLAFLLLWRYVPKHRQRQAQVSFLFMQLLTWLLGGLVVEWQLISYPVRLFHYAFRTSFSFEYLLLPTVGVLFNLYFPRQLSWLHRLLYVLSFPTILTIVEVILERYTDCIDYLHWHWFWSWLTILISLCSCYVYYSWFFSSKQKKPLSL